MKYTPVIVDDELLFYVIRNDAGMDIGSAIQNASPFEGCQPVTLKDAEANARLWAASNDLLHALETLRAAFVVAVGDKSPFAKVALIKVDEAMSKARGL